MTGVGVTSVGRRLCQAAVPRAKAGVAKLKELRADPQVRFAAQRALDKLSAK